MTTEPRTHHGMVLLISLLFLAFPSQWLSAASLPESTQKALKQLKLDSTILGNIDQELKVPDGWMVGARKEGKVVIRSSPWSPQEQRDLFAPFKERYPFMEIEFTGLNQEGRSIRTLMAYKQGRILSDLVASIGGFTAEYEAAGALSDLRDLPNWQRIPDGAKSATGAWVGIFLRHWCMSYNTRLVKKSDLPKRWEDLLVNPVWRNGNLALGNRPQLWALMLWNAHGEKWTKEFLARVFSELKPQLRKEGLNALVELVAAGEFSAAIPSNKARTYRLVLQGAPAGFTCAEPAPVSSEDMVILKGSRNANAARVFLNWLLSTEGQIASAYARQITPVREDLQLKELIPFSDQILGKKSSYRGDPLNEAAVMPELSKFWNNLWLNERRKR